jgi:hypothetical protein
MKPINQALTFVLSFAVSPIAAVAAEIPVVVSAQATEVERTAAEELSLGLSRVYPRDSFPVRPGGATPPGRSIVLGTAESRPELLTWIPRERLSRPESFVVHNAGPRAFIAGADGRGVLYGVFALLEKLGWGFYLSYDAVPQPRSEPFSFAGWSLADAPLAGDRVVFNWHNFLSSASTWELEQWQRWIRGAAAMRFNTVMVHAYGNNPMFTFRYNDQTKPIGYLTTSRRGRDWGTQHVNDVRRLVGGAAFTSAEFGSSVATGPEEHRAAAVQSLVRRAFAYARRYGMHVTFAVDVDTASANPQNVIVTLPEAARFRSGTMWLPNPDTPDGYAYWRAQVGQLLAAYPQIDRLVVWFRPAETPWRTVKPAEFPAAWQQAFNAALEKNPRLRENRDAPGMFAIGRIAAAFARALGDAGRRDVELGSGTWRFGHLPAADAFFEPQVKLYWLDASIVFADPATQSAIRAVAAHRPMLPIVWAHHDDRTYIGRSLPPFANFDSLIEGAGSGFGIIHWTTRPLDLYFKSLAEQVWEGTRNRALAGTAREAAAKSFGAAARETGGAYLVKWLTEGRSFGRETTDRFIDLPLADAAQVMARCRERRAMIDRIDASALEPEGRERLAYYRDYEAFTEAFFRSHAAYERALEAHRRGDAAGARQAVAEADPRAVIELYTRAAAHGAMTRGEQALIISLNLRWLPYIISLRQALGLEPVRFKFQPTLHEPLAQGAGLNTFWIDAHGALWKGLGEKETGAPAVAQTGETDEVCASGIRLEKPLKFKPAGIMGDKLAPGRYTAAWTGIRQGGAGPFTEKTLLEIGDSTVAEFTLRPSGIAPMIVCGLIITAEAH